MNGQLTNKPAGGIYLYSDYCVVEIPPEAFTLDGFRAWAVSDAFLERGQISFLNGELFIDLSPEEIVFHNQVKVEILCVLATLVKKQKLGVYFSNGTLLTNEEAKLSTEPDGSFVFWETLSSKGLRFVPLAGDESRSKELLGTPDWVLEIVSDSSLRKDTQQLRELYFQARVPEYWLIDARGAEISFQVLMRSERGYEPGKVTDGWCISNVFQRRFRLSRQKIEFNHWEYTLQVKPLR